MRKLILIVLLLICPSKAWACYAEPAELYAPVDELIERSESIVLAKVTKTELISEQRGDNLVEFVIYHFQPINIYKGDPAQFSLKSRIAYEGDFNSFNDHEDSAFWEKEGGRLFANPSCSISPSFAVGNVYLLFLEPNDQASNQLNDFKINHTKGAELIIKTDGQYGKKDKWLEYVEEKLK